MNILTVKPGATIRMPFPSDSVIPFEGFAVPQGSLPPGLTRDPLTGVISGVPTTPGTYHVPIYNDREAIGMVEGFTLPGPPAIP